MEEQNQIKRSWPLPVALVIIVLSLMGNVVLLTQNVNHSQAKLLEEGQQIFDAFAGSKEAFADLDRYLAQIGELSGQDGDAARLAAGFAADAAVQSGGHLRFLMSKAEQFSATEYAGAGAEAEAFIEQRLAGKLRAIGEGSGPLDAGERESLAAMTASLERLASASEQFHYAIGSNRNGLIRLSRGHDWLHIVELMRKAL